MMGELLGMNGTLLKKMIRNIPLNFSKIFSFDIHKEKIISRELIVENLFFNGAKVLSNNEINFKDFHFFEKLWISNKIIKFLIMYLMSFFENLK